MGDAKKLKDAASMKDRPIPVKLKASEAVANRQQFEAALPVAGLPRLSAAIAGTAAALEVTVQFEPYPRTAGRVSGSIRGQLPLICQRSLEVFLWPLETRFEWVLVRNESEEERLLADVDPVLLEDENLLLREAIEDEVLLALPIAPLAPQSSAEDAPQAVAAPASKTKKPAGKTKATPISDNIELDDSRPNPFAALKGLRPRH